MPPIACNRPKWSLEIAQKVYVFGYYQTSTEIPVARNVSKSHEIADPVMKKVSHISITPMTVV
jgi:hypothetical protein